MRKNLIAIVLTLLLCVPALAACGGDDGPPEAENPADVAKRLQEAGYVTGEVITDGANVGVARGGKLDADAYLSVDADPEGEPLYVGIYFFSTPEDAEVLGQERQSNIDRDFDAQVIGDRVYEIAGAPADLALVIGAAEGS